jgi:tRNA (mo5U34)-methyltransferase
MSVALARSDSVAERVAALQPWFHNLDLNGVRTQPDHFLGDFPANKFARFGHLIPDLRGKSVLDIGCNAGFYSFEMARRGAARIVGIDAEAHYLAQARFAADVLGFADRVEFRQLSVYDVGALGERFDLVLFLGVLYHLRHPLLALDLIREHVAREWLVFQTMQQGSDAVFSPPDDHPFTMPGSTQPPPYFDEPGYPKLHFIERAFAGDWTNWWAPNRAASEAMLRAAGFTVERRPDGDVYLCRVAPVPFDYWMEGVPPAAYPARGRQP